MLLGFLAHPNVYDHEGYVWVHSAQKGVSRAKSKDLKEFPFMSDMKGNEHTLVACD